MLDNSKAVTNFMNTYNNSFCHSSSGFFWNFAAEGSGYNIKDIVKICRDTESLNPETRDESTAYLANNMVRFINYRQPYKKVRSYHISYNSVLRRFKFPC